MTCRTTSVPGGGLAVPYGDEVVEPINQLIDYARKHRWLIVATRDWHDPNMKAHFEKWPVHCVQDTEGAAFHPLLELPKTVEIITKGMDPDDDAYSAFDGTTRHGMCLAEFLEDESDVKKVYVTGLATDYCVKATAIDARTYGLETILLVDACRAVNVKPDDEEKAIEEMKAAGVRIATTEEVLAGII